MPEHNCFLDESFFYSPVADTLTRTGKPENKINTINCGCQFYRWVCEQPGISYILQTDIINRINIPDIYFFKLGIFILNL